MRATCLLLMSLLLAACAAPAPDAEAVQPTRNIATPPAASPSAGGAPTQRAVQLDRSCKADADCVVKNVGSCCGEFPACVNKGSPTDPQGVQARCKAENRMSVCGFNEINACHCVHNECVGEQPPVGGWTDDPPPPHPVDR